MYLRHYGLIIYNLCFMHNLHENLLQFFIDPIGFTIERFSSLVISQNCCGVSFWSKCRAKQSAKVSEFLSWCAFWATSWKWCSIRFLEWFYFFPYKLKDFFWISPCKLHNVLYIHLHRYIFLLPSSWNYNFTHDLYHLSIRFFF